MKESELIIEVDKLEYWNEMREQDYTFLLSIIPYLNKKKCYKLRCTLFNIIENYIIRHSPAIESLLKAIETNKFEYVEDIE